MKTILGINVPETISDMLDDSDWSESYYNMSAERSGDFINDPDRASRCYDAASDGCDGSTHAEHIDDFRDFGGSLFSDLRKELESAIDDIEPDELTDSQADALRQEFDDAETAYRTDCDELELWHENNGSLNQEVG